MTNQEMLLSDNSHITPERASALLQKQGVTPNDEYVQSKGYDLAYAYSLVDIITSPDWSQGDMSEKWDRDSLTRIASNIFTQYNVPNPLNSNPKVINISDRW